MKALSVFERTHQLYGGPTDERSAGNGGLMWLVPVPMFYAGNPRLAVEMAAASSRTTHGARACLAACRYFGRLLVGGLCFLPVEGWFPRGFSGAPVFLVFLRRCSAL